MGKTGNEMVQRKLTAKEVVHAEQARHKLRGICGWTLTNRGDDYWREVDSELCSMIFYQTTDGKPYVEPYVEPQPEIGEGYRVAKDNDADRGRHDREGWSEGEWRRASVGCTIGGIVYRVPIDCIPTDDDARERPLVMVRDNGTSRWAQKRLIAVTRNPDFPFVVVKDECHSSWRYCRFPYPGE